MIKKKEMGNRKEIINNFCLCLVAQLIHIIRTLQYPFTEYNDHMLILVYTMYVQYTTRMQTQINNAIQFVFVMDVCGVRRNSTLDI